MLNSHPIQVHVHANSISCEHISSHLRTESSTTMSFSKPDYAIFYEEDGHGNPKIDSGDVTVTVQFHPEPRYPFKFEITAKGLYSVCPCCSLKVRSQSLNQDTLIITTPCIRTHPGIRTSWYSDTKLDIRTPWYWGRHSDIRTPWTLLQSQYCVCVH